MVWLILSSCTLLLLTSEPSPSCMFSRITGKFFFWHLFSISWQHREKEIHFTAKENQSRNGCNYSKVAWKMMPVNYVTTDKPFLTYRWQQWAPLSTGALWEPTFSGTTTSCQGSALSTSGAASTSSGRPSEPRQPPPAISRSLRWEMISTRSVQFPSVKAWRKKVGGATQWWNHDSCVKSLTWLIITNHYGGKTMPSWSWQWTHIRYK